MSTSTHMQVSKWTTEDGFSQDPKPLDSSRPSVEVIKLRSAIRNWQDLQNPGTCTPSTDRPSKPRTVSLPTSSRVTPTISHEKGRSASAPAITISEVSDPSEQSFTRIKLPTPDLLCPDPGLNSTAGSQRHDSVISCTSTSSVLSNLSTKTSTSINSYILPTPKTSELDYTPHSWIWVDDQMESTDEFQQDVRKILDGDGRESVFAPLPTSLEEYIPNDEVKVFPYDLLRSEVPFPLSPTGVLSSKDPGTGHMPMVRGKEGVSVPGIGEGFWEFDDSSIPSNVPTDQVPGRYRRSNDLIDQMRICNLSQEERKFLSLVTGSKIHSQHRRSPNGEGKYHDRHVIPPTDMFKPLSESILDISMGYRNNPYCSKSFVADLITESASSQGSEVNNRLRELRRKVCLYDTADGPRSNVPVKYGFSGSSADLGSKDPSFVSVLNDADENEGVSVDHKRRAKGSFQRNDRKTSAFRRLKNRLTPLRGISSLDSRNETYTIDQRISSCKALKDLLDALTIPESMTGLNQTIR